MNIKMMAAVHPKNINVPSDPNVEIMLNFESEHWRQVDFDVTAVTSTLVNTVLKEFVPGSYQGEISIILSHDQHLHHLNKTYRHQDKATNVLSFDYGPNAFDKGIIGDVFVSFETLTQEAVAQQKSLQNHFSHLIIHGVLHLLGYDHEHEQDAKEMEQLEIEFLKQMNISNPYIN
ncbi:MAG: rRNA maturation RNase YbeY [Janthinobacterium lividum]